MTRKQILANANGVPFANPALATNFYGLLSFDIVDGEIHQYEEIDVTANRVGASSIDAAPKQEEWSLLRSIVRSMCRW